MCVCKKRLPKREKRQLKEILTSKHKALLTEEYERKGEREREKVQLSEFVKTREF